ncbi:MAG: hypothetical protein DMG96_40370 [Acidobacteria bacterium]|nr:MAG: hypothetical protein DMG96_40370 [Acidobacteriota bacterium]HEU0047409.1 hypothetical protein [Nitrososphaera sp.]
MSFDRTDLKVIFGGLGVILLVAIIGISFEPQPSPQPRPVKDDPKDRARILQTSESKQAVMSLQFKEHALRAFHAIERLDPDDPDRYFQSQSAHRAVNNLFDKIKTPLDKQVDDILFTWLAEIEVGRMDTKVHPASWNRWMRAEVECQTEASFYFGGLTEEGKKEAAQKIAQQTCITTARELHIQ